MDNTTLPILDRETLTAVEADLEKGKQYEYGKKILEEITSYNPIAAKFIKSSANTAAQRALNYINEKYKNTKIASEVAGIIQAEVQTISTFLYHLLDEKGKTEQLERELGNQ